MKSQAAMTNSAEQGMAVPSEADALAWRVAQAMFAADAASRETMGMDLIECLAGSASMRMQVRALHLNGHLICHGGFIFTLADSTFAFACNSHNKVTVASGLPSTCTEIIGSAVYTDNHVRLVPSGIPISLPIT